MPDSAQPVPGAVLCHGLGSGKGSMRSSGLNLAKRGICVLIFDFRGHGRSEGVFDGDEAEDVIEAWQWLSQYEGVDRQRIALVGHSMGARAALIASSRIDSLGAVVALSCLADMDRMASQDIHFDLEKVEKHGAAPVEYPRDGVFPWLRGVPAMVFRVWMRLRGYRLLIDWNKYIARMSDTKVSTSVEGLAGCPKLFVHSRGDKQIPYHLAVELYQDAPEPRELMLAKRGWHSTPLMPGSLRRRWINWVTNVLTRGPDER